MRPFIIIDDTLYFYVCMCRLSLSSVAQVWSFSPQFRSSSRVSSRPRPLRTPQAGRGACTLTTASTTRPGTASALRSGVNNLPEIWKKGVLAFHKQPISMQNIHPWYKVCLANPELIDTAKCSPPRDLCLSNEEFTPTVGCSGPKMIY